MQIAEKKGVSASVIARGDASPVFEFGEQSILVLWQIRASNYRLHQSRDRRLTNADRMKRAASRGTRGRPKPVFGVGIGATGLNGR